MAFDPSADPIVSQTTQGVTANDLKTYGHTMDLFAHQNALFANQNILDSQAEGRRSRMLSEQLTGALATRAVDVILGRQISDAVSDAIGGQVGAKVAESTPPETGVTTAMAQLQALFQSSNNQSNQVIQQLLALLGQNPVGVAKA